MCSLCRFFSKIKKSFWLCFIFLTHYWILTYLVSFKHSKRKNVPLLFAINSGIRPLKKIRNKVQCVQHLRIYGFLTYLTLVRYLVFNFVLISVRFLFIRRFFYYPKYRFLIHSEPFSVFFFFGLTLFYNLTTITFVCL